MTVERRGVSIRVADNGTLAFSSSAAQTLSGVISGTGGLSQNGRVGQLTLSGTNLFGGATIFDRRHASNLELIGVAEQHAELRRRQRSTSVVQRVKYEPLSVAYQTSTTAVRKCFASVSSRLRLPREGSR